MAITSRTADILKIALADRAAGDDLSANISAVDPITIGSLASNGLVTRTSSSTSSARTVTGTANQITVTNGDGVAGNPTVSLPVQPNVTTGYAVGGTKVVGAQGAAVIDATDATTVIAQLNALLARCRAHGLIA